MRRSGPRVSRRLLLMLMVLGLHLALLSLLQRAGGGLSAPTRAAPDAQTQRLSIPLRLLPLPAVSEPRAQRPAAAPSRAAGPAARPSLSPSPKPAAPTAQAAPVLAEATPPQAEPPASAPLPRLLDSEATRRALRQSALETPTGPPQALAENSQQRLERGMKGSAHGDCLKSEFLGGGMGLLSAPFWLLAEARGKCSR
ncbi:UNVERIFIED_ORG: hypothetical protein LHJ69_11360 [Shinella sp. XGS7]|nr:hypothetical protein [Shinella sp. XGS7]